MSTGPEYDDAVLLEELAVLLQGRSEPPPEVLLAAREIFTWRTVDAEIAALTYDSLFDDAPATVRATDPPRILTFEVAALTIEVELEHGPAGRRLFGQLVPAQEADVELRCEREVVGTAEVDAMGRFVIDLTGACKRITVRCHLRDGSVVESASAPL